MDFNQCKEMADTTKLNIHRYVRPFKEMKKLDKFLAFIFFSFVVGQFGIIASIINSNSKMGAILFNIKLGNFYTFSIACIGINMYTFIEEIIFEREDNKNNKVKFFGLKMVLNMISALIGLYMLIVCSNSINSFNISINELISTTGQAELIIQFALYIIIILITIYLWCLKIAAYDKVSYENISDLDNSFKDEIDENTKNLSDEVENIDEKDDEGVVI